MHNQRFCSNLVQQHCSMHVSMPCSSCRTRAELMCVLACSCSSRIDTTGLCSNAVAVTSAAAAAMTFVAACAFRSSMHATSSWMQARSRR